MNYRHNYHAGNFADVMKHFILTLVLQKLQEKEKPFFVLDTHAGIGMYDFMEEAAQKTGEYRDGIGRLVRFSNLSNNNTNTDAMDSPLPVGEVDFPNFLSLRKEKLAGNLVRANVGFDKEGKPSPQPSPTGRGSLRICLSDTTIQGEEGIHPYLHCIHQLNPDGALRYYPGSPLIIRHFLRPQDRAAFCELHPEDVETLKQHIGRDKRIMVRHEDAYTALKAFLPPQERRGLVLIDPPFEKKDEFDKLIKGLKEAYRRFATGIYAIWFPIKNRPPVDSFYEMLTHSGIPTIMTAEFLIAPPDTPERLNGCGMVFINPPWQLDTTLTEALPLLLRYVGKEEEGGVGVRWLVQGR